MSAETTPLTAGKTPGHATATGRTWTIMNKEFREMFRDRRTLMSVVISPLLITPAMFALIGILVGSQTEKAKTQSYDVGVVGPPIAMKLMEKLGDGAHIRFAATTEAEAESRIKDKKQSAVLVFPEDMEAKLEAGNTVQISIMQDAGNEKSQQASARLNGLIGAVGQQIVAKKLETMNLSTEFATPFKVAEKPIKTGGSEGMFFLSMMLPYMLVVSSFGGAIYAAFDQVAGEKERGTLETLLVSPASRGDIVLGKFGAVVGVCLLSSLLSIIGLFISFNMKSKAFAWIAKGGMHLTPAALGAVLLVMLPLAILFAGLLLAISTFARNQKEAQTYLAPLFIAVLMPAMASMFVGTDSGLSIALIPVLNAALIIKQALSDSFNVPFILTAFAASIFYAAIALIFATRLFQKESVLIKA